MSKNSWGGDVIKSAVGPIVERPFCILPSFGVWTPRSKLQKYTILYLAYLVLINGPIHHWAVRRGRERWAGDPKASNISNKSKREAAQTIEFKYVKQNFVWSHFPFLQNDYILKIIPRYLYLSIIVLWKAWNGEFKMLYWCFYWNKGSENLFHLIASCRLALDESLPAKDNPISL